MSEKNIFVFSSTAPAWIFMLMMAVFTQSCAPKVHAPERPEPVITREQPFGPTMSVEMLIKSALKRQFSALETIFKEPYIEPGNELYLISRERPMLILEKGVTSYAGGADQVAAGYADGSIRVWSNFPCPAVALPDRGAVSSIWWNNDTRYLSAQGKNRSKVSIFDMNRCSRVADLELQGNIEKVAVSSSGRFMAAVDAGGRLWTGKVNEPLQHVATLRYDPLDMVFTPREGVLMLADRAGWLMLWTVEGFSLLEQTLISGGPFANAEFSGSELMLSGPDGTMVFWDIYKAREMTGTKPRGRFLLQEQVLYFVFSQEQDIKRVMIPNPGFSVYADEQNMALKVRDLDGIIRFYAAGSGLEIHKPEHFVSQEAVSVSDSGEFFWKGVWYTLADPIQSGPEFTLWSRQVPGAGHFMWWLHGSDKEKQDFQGFLPVRESIRREIPPQWMSMGETFF